jgi:GT2 family glycosyltransferase
VRRPRAGEFQNVRGPGKAPVEGFDAGFSIWGADDSELSIRLWTLGYQCLVAPQVEVAHHFRRERPYSLGWEQVLYNKLRLAALYFGEARRQSVIERLQQNKAFPSAFARLCASDAGARRCRIQSFRLHDDAWFFDRFPMGS